MKIYRLYNKFKSDSLNIPKLCNGKFSIHNFNDKKVEYKYTNSDKIEFIFELSDSCKLTVKKDSDIIVVPIDKYAINDYDLLEKIKEIKEKYKNTPLDLDEIINIFMMI